MKGNLFERIYHRKHIILMDEMNEKSKSTKQTPSMIMINDE